MNEISIAFSPEELDIILNYQKLVHMETVQEAICFAIHTHLLASYILTKNIVNKEIERDEQ